MRQLIADLLALFGTAAILTGLIWAGVDNLQDMGNRPGPVVLVGSQQ